MHLEQLSFLPTLYDAEHASWLLNGKQAEAMRAYKDVLCERIKDLIDG